MSPVREVCHEKPLKQTIPFFEPTYCCNNNHHDYYRFVVIIIIIHRHRR